VGRRTVLRDIKRLDRDFDGPARVLAVRGLSKARAQGRRDTTNRHRDPTKAFSDERACR